MFTGASYLSGYTGYDKYKGDCLKKWIDKWERKICAVTKTAKAYSQKIYAVVACDIRLKWIFWQRVTKHTVHMLKLLEKVLRETFLPHLLFETSKTLPLVVGALHQLTVKIYGMGLHNPVLSSADKYNSSLHAIFNLIGAVMGER